MFERDLKPVSARPLQLPTKEQWKFAFSPYIRRDRDEKSFHPFQEAQGPYRGFSVGLRQAYLQAMSGTKKLLPPLPKKYFRDVETGTFKFKRPDNSMGESPVFNPRRLTVDEDFYKKLMEGSYYQERPAFIRTGPLKGTQAVREYILPQVGKEIQRREKVIKGLLQETVKTADWAATDFHLVHEIGSPQSRSLAASVFDRDLLTYKQISLHHELEQISADKKIFEAYESRAWARHELEYSHRRVLQMFQLMGGVVTALQFGSASLEDGKTSRNIRGYGFGKHTVRAFGEVGGNIALSRLGYTGGAALGALIGARFKLASRGANVGGIAGAMALGYFGPIYGGRIADATYQAI